MPLTFTDQMNRPVPLDAPPQRIVSLVPSQTELLYDLGLDEQVVGITKFCVHPKRWFRTKQRIGGTKQVHLDRMAQLQPDLIIGNKEENTREDITALAGQWPVWMSDIYHLSDALDMIRKLGQVCDRTSRAHELAGQIQAAFRQIPTPSSPRPRVLYLIWRKPYMAVAKNTFIDDMLTQAGFSNALSDQERYPELTEQDIHTIAPDCVFLSSEPYPFRQKHLNELQALCPQAALHLVDGELFSWYGSRLLRAPAYFRQLRQAVG